MNTEPVAQIILTTAANASFTSSALENASFLVEENPAARLSNGEEKELVDSRSQSVAFNDPMLTTARGADAPDLNVAVEKSAAGNSLLSPESGARDATQMQPLPKDSNQEKHASLSELLFEQQGESGELVARNVSGPSGSVFPEVMREGKREEAEHNALQMLTDARHLAPNVLGNVQISASQTHASGYPVLGNIESWQIVVSQVADGLVANIQQNNHEVRLQLDPPELGKLDIQLVLEGERLQAHITAESADIGALIQSHLSELKHALQSHRLDLDAVRVDVQSEGRGRNPSSHDFQQEARSQEQGGRFNDFSQSAGLEGETSLNLVTGYARGRVNVWA